MIPLESNIAEVTLLGTGGGYGESIVIHLGQDQWAVIDSCVNPKTGECLPLLYLESIGVDIASSLRLILISHWHDDHIKGISSLYRKAANSELFVGYVQDRSKFMAFVGFDYKKLDTDISVASTVEFVNCIKILKSRSKQVRKASIDTRLWKVDLKDGQNSYITALAPSNYASHLFDKEISSLITEYGHNPNLKFPKKSPNHSSVAVVIKLGLHSTLLGADLELVNDDRLGWLNVLDHSTCTNKSSSLFKPSHHGSENGNHNRIWTEFLVDKPMSKITPYNRGHKLPSIEMLEYLKEKSEKLYVTSPLVSKKSRKGKKRDVKIETIIGRFSKKLEERKFEFGSITCRIDMLNAKAEWEVTIDGTALEVSEEIIAHKKQ